MSPGEDRQVSDELRTVSFVPVTAETQQTSECVVTCSRQRQTEFLCSLCELGRRWKSGSCCWGTSGCDTWLWPDLMTDSPLALNSIQWDFHLSLRSSFCFYQTSLKVWKVKVLRLRPVSVGWYNYTITWLLLMHLCRSSTLRIISWQSGGGEVAQNRNARVKHRKVTLVSGTWGKSTWWNELILRHWSRFLQDWEQ